MLRLKRKGQAATEYLMTYGWALLAIAIVGALLYTQVFSKRACGTAGANGFSQVNTVVPTGVFSISHTGTFQIEVENRMNRDVKITGIEFKVGSTIINGTINSITLSNGILANNDIIPAGMTATIQGSASISGASPGKCYSLQTVIKYDVMNDNDSVAVITDLTNSGTLNGKYA